MSLRVGRCWSLLSDIIEITIDMLGMAATDIIWQASSASCPASSSPGLLTLGYMYVACNLDCHSDATAYMYPCSSTAFPRPSAALP